MPRIQTYDSPQVEQRPLGGVRQDSIASPSLFAAGATEQLRAGNQLVNAGTELGKIALDMQNRENADMLFRAETSIRTEYLDFEKAARERRGDAAKDITKEAGEWWDKKAAEHSDGLQNDAQKRLFGQSISKLRIQSVDGMSAYESEQRRVALNEANTASITSSINLAASQVGTPTEKAAVAGAKTDILKRIAVTGQINGWSPEMREAKEAESLTNLHLQVIQNMIDREPKRAKEYFDLNKKEINGTQYNDVEKALKVGTTKEVAQEVADTVMAKGMSEAEALAHVREKYSGDEEAAAVLEIKTRFSEITGAREREQATAADKAYKIYADTGRLSAIPADTMAKLDGKVVLALRNDARLKAEGVTAKTDWDKYYRLRTLAYADPVAFAKRDLRGDFTYLGKAEREGMIDLQSKINKPDEMKEIATLDNQLADYHDKLKLGGSSNAEKRGMFDTVVKTTLSSEQRAKGRGLTFEERQRTIDRLIVEGDINGAWLGGGRRLYEVTGTSDESKFVVAVPKDEQVKIVDYYTRTQKRKPTDAEITEAYKKKMGLK